MKKHNFTFTILCTIVLIGIGCTATGSKNNNTVTMNIQDSLPQGKAAATFGAGCFWCVEAVFQQLDGVDTVISGYCGGNVPNPTYREVCYGKTGHAEVCRIVYDTTKISYRDLLQALFMSHDPTQLNRQGNDIGTQYRSAIFYHNDAQKAEAEKVIAELTADKVFSSPIVTTLEPLQTFYIAEDYHQNYYNLNGDEPYCSFVIKPKVEKFKKVFQHQLKQKP
ncbi:MAG: peptide-methionine (S)-S-oxide reductase MsrA [Bacteroidota bacterium]|jgi:peptide-methionine (S)-S-oxide reductase